ncbi:SLC13 family permease [Paenibacillus lignilyticus]|uniref:Anion permease n=1 Tax=Paenibacillus lignilyticus TaxID=1172615 RepID=A0ABS5CEQ8_9BACL|nr:SLC13 family permease [Paenibacillus lignilyticus]MBP3961537.1 anion permease [Paenibacillus lignilyticus]MBP3963793.1 anion permease [Paenibacillus lignilyticus]
MKLIEIEMFKQLSNMELAKLLGKLERLTLQAGATLFEQGDPGDTMYIIDSGTIELFTRSDGMRHSLAFLHEGDTLGEMALLTGEARSAMAVATTNVVLMQLDRETFDALITEHPTISAYFIRLISQRLTHTNERLRDSKEMRSQWIMQELKQLPEPLVQFLLWSAHLATIHNGLIELRFGFSLQEKMKQYPVLTKFLSVDDDGMNEPQWSKIKLEAKSALIEMATAAHSYKEKRQWIEDAQAFYTEQEQWLALAVMYKEEGNWDKVVHTVIRQQAMSEPEETQTFGLLLECPIEVLLRCYAALELAVRLGLVHGPEEGLRIVEHAVREGTLNDNKVKLISLYEWGAELSRLLHNRHKALEYLQLAEAAAQVLSGRWPQAIQDEEREYQLAQQKLTNRKSMFFAERASRLINPSQWARWLALVMALSMIVIFYFMPPAAGLTDKGMLFIGIAIAAVILWIVNIIPDYIVALGMAMLWVLGGVVKPEVALSGFASPTWLYMIFIMSISVVITKSGILYRLSLHALKRFPPHFRGQLWGIVAGGIVLNPLIPSSSAKVSLGVPIAQTLSESMGFKDRSHGAAGLGLAAMVFYGFTAPFVLTGSYTNVMAYSLAGAAVPVTWLEWALYALPAFAVFGTVMLVALSLMFSGSTIAVKQVSGKVLDEQIRLLGPLTNEERISVCTVVGCIVLMMLQPLHGIDSTWIMLIGFSVLVISSVLDRQSLISGIDWTFLIFLGIAFSFANVANELGIVESLTDFLGSNMSFFISSPALFLTAVIVLCFIVTLIVRDDPAVILLVTALLPLSQQAGVHPWILVFVILLSTDPFFFSYQSPTYLTAYFSSEERAFSHRQGQKVAFGYALAVLLAVVVSVPYWKWIGLLH